MEGLTMVIRVFSDRVAIVLSTNLLRQSFVSVAWRSIVKIWESLNFQFRLDAFNVINHTNFQAPSGALSVTADTHVPTLATFSTSSSFGKIAGTQPNRQMQVSARFFF